MRSMAFKEGGYSVKNNNEILLTIDLLSRSLHLERSEVKNILCYLGVYGFNEPCFYNEPWNILEQIRNLEMEQIGYSIEQRRIMLLEKERQYIVTFEEVVDTLLPFSQNEKDSLFRVCEMWGNDYIERGIENLSRYFPYVIKSL